LFAVGLHTCTAVARSLCVSWAFLLFYRSRNSNVCTTTGVFYRRSADRLAGPKCCPQMLLLRLVSVENWTTCSLNAVQYTLIGHLWRRHLFILGAANFVNASRQKHRREWALGTVVTHKLPQQQRGLMRQSPSH